MRRKFRQFNHDEGARIAINALLQNIKSNQAWQNLFLKSDICKTRTKKTKPSPDGRFYSPVTKCHVALEFKPPYSSLDEVGKGFSQCHDYIIDTNSKGEILNQAAYLVVPSINQAKIDIKSLYTNKFLKTVLNKNAISLVTYNPVNIDQLELVVDFGEGLHTSNVADIYGRNEITYWAAWRENYPSFNYNLLKVAAYMHEEHNNPSTDKIWEHFYENYYCYPKNADETLDLLESNLFTWGETKSIWQEATKKELRKAVIQNLITEKEAIYRLKWASASSSEERKYFGRKILDIPIKRPRHIDRDNDFQDIKKNRRNFLSHVGLWDNLTWKPTSIGLEFIKRIEFGANPMVEMGCLILFCGRWFELIDDIKRHQSSFPHNNSNDFKRGLKEIFLHNGIIGINPGRKVSGSRNFLQSEQQVLGRLNILEKDNNQYYFKNVGFKFNEKKIEEYLNVYYEIYADILDAA